MTSVRWLMSGFCVVTLLAVPSVPVSAQSAKASRACRKVIGSKYSKVVQTGLSVISACHNSRDKGKFAGDCNDLAQADVKGKIAKVESSASVGIGKKCVIGDPVLGNYPSADPDSAFFPIAKDAVQTTATTLLGSPQIQTEKAKIKCHAAISKAALGDIGEILKNAVKCQNGLDKLADTFGPIQGDCLATPVSAGPKGEKAITKACTGIAAADVGSCDPLPTCVTSSTTTTGQALVGAIYGKPTPGCGNGIVDPGEECDDGNHISTDNCIDCKLATCGDGFVHAGVELCGDSMTDACTAPSQSTCQVAPCAAAGTMRTVTVRFSKPADQTVDALIVALDYPETQVRIPGIGGDAQVLSRVNIPLAANGLPQTDDRDYEVQVSLTAGSPLDPGVLFSVDFDDCSSVPAPTPDEFACIVRSASNDAGNDITSQVKCSVVTP
jgi:cysteine-rich repeat protein